MNAQNFKNKIVLTAVAVILFSCITTSKASAEETTTTPSPNLPLPTSDTSTPVIINIILPTSTSETIPTDSSTLTPLPTTTSETDSVAIINTPSVNLNIRYNNNLIFSNNVNLPTSSVIIDSEGNSEITTSTTVLTTLISVQNQTRDFSISNLQHSSYGYYLKCLYLSINSTSTCDNWNYVVDNRYPSIGMDSYQLHGGENIYIYFGDSWKITSDRNIFSNTSTNFYTWKYEYSDINKDWVIDANDLVAITIPNPNPVNSWDTDITVSTTLSNDQGVANYYFTSAGTYSAKITSNDYSKWSNPISFTVTELSTSTSNETATTTTSTNQYGSSSSSNTQTNNAISTTQINDTITKLINFLKSNQDTDGKISDINTSDWSTMAFGSKNIYADDVKKIDKSLYNFVYNTKIEDLEKESNKCAAYSRHILALLSAGTTKTDTKIIELKNKLDTACVQNNLFGLSGINDDVFGLLAALALDEDQNSPVVVTTIKTIKADQQNNGSFTWDGWSGADMTGAAINALKYAQNKGTTIDQSVFIKAKQYLKSQQLADGGWGFGSSDALTTSWAMMGINALGENQNDWFTSAGKNPWYILTTLDNDHYTQSWDGGIDWFGTKHAVPALLGNTWPIILDPKTITNNQNGGGVLENIQNTTSTTSAASTLTTTTISISTSTTSTILTTTTPEIIVSTSTTSTILIKEDVKPQPTLFIAEKIAVSRTNSTPSFTKNIKENKNEELSSIPNTTNNNQIIDDLPLDTQTKRTAKKVLAVSGGSALVVGVYLGLRLLRNVV